MTNDGLPSDHCYSERVGCQKRRHNCDTSFEGAWQHASPSVSKIKIRKFLLKASQSFWRKFAQSEISCYTVYHSRLVLLARKWQHLTLATAHIRARVVCSRRRSPHLPSQLYHCWTELFSLCLHLSSPTLISPTYLILPTNVYHFAYTWV